MLFNDIKENYNCYTGLLKVKSVPLLTWLLLKLRFQLNKLLRIFYVEYGGENTKIIIKNLAFNYLQKLHFLNETVLTFFQIEENSELIFILSCKGLR